MTKRLPSAGAEGRQDGPGRAPRVPVHGQRSLRLPEQLAPVRFEGLGSWVGRVSTRGCSSVRDRVTTMATELPQLPDGDTECPVLEVRTLGVSQGPEPTNRRFG